MGREFIMSLRTIVIPGLMIAALSACQKEAPKVVDSRSADTVGQAAALRKPVVMPPSIAATKQYRCADGSLAFAEFYSDDLSASVKSEAKASAVRIVAPAKGEAMVGGGYSLKGTKADANIVFGTPTHPKPQKCHV